jgi:hypothetical protein
LVALTIFAVFLLFFAVYSFFLVYHLYEFSMNSGNSLILITTYLVIAAILTVVVLFYVLQIDWSAPAFTLGLVHK